ncbi:MAG: hypothetical protein PGN11_07905 [Quadrisphaera sp.]
MRSSRALTVAVVVALVVLVGAVVVFTSTGMSESSFGWFAYSPLQSVDFAYVAGAPTLLTPPQVAAAVVAALALAATTGLLGYALGRRVSGPLR